MEMPLILEVLARARMTLSNALIQCPNQRLGRRLGRYRIRELLQEWNDHIFEPDHPEDCSEVACIAHYPQINEALHQLHVAVGMFNNALVVDEAENTEASTQLD